MALSAENLQRRRRFICGSDAALVMSGEWPKLWRIKTGRAQEDDLSEVFEVQIGHVTEQFNLDWLAARTGRPVERRGEWIECRRNRFMAANLDGVTRTPQGRIAYVDAKHVGRFDEQTILRYTPQGVHCATILGLDWWGLCPIVGNKWPGPTWQEIDPIYQANLVAREREFWGYVERDEEPPDMTETKVLAPKPKPKLRTILLDELTRGGTDWPNWAIDFTRLAREFAETHSAAAKHAIVRKEIAALVPDDVGLVRFGLIEYKRDGRGQTIALKKGEENDAPRT